MAMQTGLTPGMGKHGSGIAGMDVSTIMSTNVAGLVAKQLKGLLKWLSLGFICWSNGRYDGSWSS